MCCVYGIYMYVEGGYLTKEIDSDIREFFGF